jgi:regulatory protein
VKNDKTTKLTFDEAIKKAKKYCAIQEHCTSEVKAKLTEWHVEEEIREEIISQLVKENYLSEFRYADLFTRSKINQKRWGRLKIQFELQQRFVPAEIINKAFSSIDEKQYLENLRFLKIKKEKETDEDDEFKREMKIKAYLATKGYEYEDINKLFK